MASRWTTTSLAAAMAIAALAAPPAMAQKNSGPLLPTTPPPVAAPRPMIPPPTYAPPSYSTPSYAPSSQAPMAQPPSAGAPGGNPDVERQAQALPLDPATRDLQDQLPADPRRVQRALGLRAARGPVTDLRGHTASPREIVDALAPR